MEINPLMFEPYARGSRRLHSDVGSVSQLGSAVRPVPYDPQKWPSTPLETIASCEASMDSSLAGKSVQLSSKICRDRSSKCRLKDSLYPQNSRTASDDESQILKNRLQQGDDVCLSAAGSAAVGSRGVVVADACGNLLHLPNCPLVAMARAAVLQMLFHPLQRLHVSLGFRVGFATVFGSCDMFTSSDKSN